ncbi:MAG: exo-alpha-sialidase [Deferribacteres bacterium]|nr:exo-alpha-sialidase [candidate division KSB1 bacterium]MCB9500524.1 exo-alpha-sialidase [Deferribacteres bacterium]
MNTKFSFLLFFLFFKLPLLNAQIISNSELIFPPQEKHVHSSSIVECPDGSLLACWFEGSGERSADDVRIRGARLKKGQHEWSEVFEMADTPDYPDCNPILYLDHEQRLVLMWMVVVANRWETSVLKYRISENYMNAGTPIWQWQDVLFMKNTDSFQTSIEKGFKSLPYKDLAWAAYAPKYEKMLVEAAADPTRRETGWMTRIAPTFLPTGRILLPLYSDGYNLSLVAISDDNGQTWFPSAPIVGKGNVQPVILRKKSGALVAYMRDNGDPPGRIMVSHSDDDGLNWTPATDTDIPNPGASVTGLVLRDGSWCLVYNNTENGRNNLTIAFSVDDGANWQQKIVLEEAEKGKGSFAYPAMIQAANGRIHLSYSWHKDKKSIKHVAMDVK